MPQLSIPPDDTPKGFTKTAYSAHTHGPDFVWDDRLARRTLKFLNSIRHALKNGDQEYENLKANYYQSFVEAKSKYDGATKIKKPYIVRADRNKLSVQDNRSGTNSDDYLIGYDNNIYKESGDQKQITVFQSQK